MAIALATVMLLIEPMPRPTACSVRLRSIF